MPHYKLILAGSADGERTFEKEVARRCDRLLSDSDINCEYQAKRETGRLAAVQMLTMSWTSFAERVAGSLHGAGWENQFKFLPLLRDTWESFEPWESSERRPSAANGHEPTGALGEPARAK